MQFKLITAPTIEPITLAQLKLHMRLSSGSFADNIDENQSIVPGDHVVAAAYSLEGTGVDVLGYTAVVILNSGTYGAGGTVDVKIQESDDNVTFTDWGTAFTQVTEANDNAIQEKEYTGTKQYIRTVATVAVATCDFGTTVIRLTATTIEDNKLTDDIQGAREHIEDITSKALLTQTWDCFIDYWPDKNYIKLPFGNLQTVTYVKYTESDGTITNLTKNITAFADSATSPGTKTTVTSAAHGYSDGDMVHISGTTSYNGGWEISNVTTNTFDITTAFIADDATGTASTYYIVETNGEQCGRVVLPYAETWPSFTAYSSNPIVIRFVCGWTAAASIPAKIRDAAKLIATDLYVNREAQVMSSQDYRENKTVMRLLGSSVLYDEFL